jgi:hypothetical protein
MRVGEVDASLRVATDPTSFGFPARHMAKFARVRWAIRPQVPPLTDKVEGDEIGKGWKMLEIFFIICYLNIPSINCFW